MGDFTWGKHDLQNRKQKQEEYLKYFEQPQERDITPYLDIHPFSKHKTTITTKTIFPPNKVTISDTNKLILSPDVETI